MNEWNHLPNRPPAGEMKAKGVWDRGRDDSWNAGRVLDRTQLGTDGTGHEANMTGEREATMCMVRVDVEIGIIPGVANARQGSGSQARRRATSLAQAR
jgi:hypothetical protein